MMVFSTDKINIEFRCEEVTSFCAGTLLYDAHVTNARTGVHIVGHTILACLKEYSRIHHLPSIFINDAVGGIWYEHLLHTLYKNTPVGGVINDGDFTIVLSPPYLNTNSGNTVVSAMFINTSLKYLDADESYEEEEVEDVDSW